MVTAWSGIAALSEACAGTAPVYVVSEVRHGGKAARMVRRLIALDHARPLQDKLLQEWLSESESVSGTTFLAAWPRTPLDEAGRIAGVIRRRLFVGAGSGSV